MVEVYTDGSFSLDTASSSCDKWCAGVGLVIRVLNDSFPLSLNREEYYSIRYTKTDLCDISQLLCDEEVVTSTLIECLAFKEGLNIALQVKQNCGLIKFYVDDSLTIKIVRTYIDIILQGGDITKSRRFGVYMKLLSRIFPNNIDILKKIKIQHISAHRNNKYNNMADSLASYKSSPSNRVISCLVHGEETTNILDKKQYFLTLNKYKNQLFEK